MKRDEAPEFGLYHVWDGYVWALVVDRSSENLELTYPYSYEDILSKVAFRPSTIHPESLACDLAADLVVAFREELGHSAFFTNRPFHWEDLGLVTYRSSDRADQLRRKISSILRTHLKQPIPDKLFPRWARRENIVAQPTRVSLDPRPTWQCD